MSITHFDVSQWLGLGTEPQQLELSQMALRGVVIFLAALVMLRLAHKRFFARRNAIDVLMALILASTLARAINGSAAFFPTIFVGFLLVLVHRLLVFLAARWHPLDTLLKGTPATLIEHGQVNEPVLRAHSLSRHDLDEDLRLQSISSPSEVKRAIIERNGEVSVQRQPRIHTIKVEAGVQTVRLEVG